MARQPLTISGTVGANLPDALLWRVSTQETLLPLIGVVLCVLGRVVAVGSWIPLQLLVHFARFADPRAVRRNQTSPLVPPIPSIHAATALGASVPRQFGSRAACSTVDQVIRAEGE